jgi:hypothetical protein
VTGQLDSPHFFRLGDTVRRSDGLSGTIVEAWSLYAVIRWEDGPQEEREQFDPEIIVVTRGR